jgi:hypothetical protein
MSELIKNLPEMWDAKALSLKKAEPKIARGIRECSGELLAALAAEPRVTEEQVRITPEQLEHCLWTSEGEEFDLDAACERINALLAPQSAPTQHFQDNQSYFGGRRAEPAPKCTCTGSELDFECQIHHGNHIRQLAEPAPFCPGDPLAPHEKVDLVKKWRKLAEEDHTEAQADGEYAEYYNGRSIAASICADELAAWLPIHDAKVRLEEAELLLEADCRGCIEARVAQLRILASQPGSSGGGR